MTHAGPGFRRIRPHTSQPRQTFLATMALAGLLLAGACVLGLITLLPTVSFAQMVSFGSPADFTVDTGPGSVAIGDLNRDGKLDVVTASFNNSTVSVRLGTGTGTMGTVTNFGVGTNPFYVTIGDLNRDGIPDLAVANLNSNDISIVLGTGSGSFGAPTNYPVNFAPTWVEMGDFDRDGDLDLATANFLSGPPPTVSVLLNNGTGSFGAETDFIVGSQPASVAIGDFNRDGNADLAVANHNANSVSVLLGDGTGSFGGATNFTVTGGPVSVATADLNRDGRLDLAVGTGGSNVAILLGTGTGAFGPATTFPAGASNLNTIAIGDLNGDGHLDVMVPNAVGGSTTVAVLLGTGTGAFGVATSFAAGDVPTAAAIGDFNGDGKPDLAVANNASNNASILLNTTVFMPAGGFPLAGAVSTGGTDTAHVAEVDADGDGDLDLATVNLNSDNVSILLGNGLGGFTSALGSPVSVGNAPRVVSSADFDRDGDADLAVTVLDGIWMFFNNGSGVFTTSSFTVSGAHHHEIGDVNQDGKPDLVVAAGGRGVEILLGDGAGGFSPAAGSPVATGVSAGASELVLGDFNRDGKLDIAVENSSPNTIAILKGDGSGGFTLDSSIDVGGHSGGGGGGMVVGDLNRDGILDLAAAVVAETSTPDHFVAVLIGNGSGGFTAGTAVNVSGAISVAIGDLDRNGILDIAVVSSSPNGVHVLSGNGSGGFTEVTGSPFLAGGALSDYAAVGDLNRDGRLDLAVGNITPDNVSILLNTAPGAAADFTLAPTPGSRTVVQGQSASYTISFIAQNGFSSPVSLSVTSVLPTGVSASFLPDAVTPPGFAALIVSTAGSTTPGDYSITIQGRGDSQMSGTSVDLTVLAAGGGGLPLAISPASATVADGTQFTVSASGGTGSYTFTLVTNASGGSFDPSTRLYTAGSTAGTDKVQVTDGTATVEADLMVVVVMGDVHVSLDGRALAGLGSAQTFNVFADSGGTVLVGFSTDRVHELNLLPGTYSLTAGASSFDFSVTGSCALTLP